MKAYLKRLLIAWSIFLNVFLGGKSNQTFSATQYQRYKDRKWNLCWFINLIFWDEDHCMESWIKWKIIHSAINKNSNLYENF